MSAPHPSSSATPTPTPSSSPPLHFSENELQDETNNTTTSNTTNNTTTNTKNERPLQPPKFNSLEENEKFLYNSLYSPSTPDSPYNLPDDLNIGPTLGLENLEQEFCDNPLFLSQIVELKKKCTYIRRIKKDGCCFYRAFLFGLFEFLLNNKSQLVNYQNSIKDIRELIQYAGYTMNTVEDFYEEFQETLRQLSMEDSNITTVLDACNSMTRANYLVVFARLLTGTYIKLNSTYFEPFIYPLDAEKFCKLEVDPMWAEAEQMQVIALCSILNVCISIHSLSTYNSNTTVQTFPDSESTPMMNFLYRPGHYDLLYLK